MADSQEILDQEQGFMNHLKDSLDKLQQRIQEKTSNHEQYMQERSGILTQQRVESVKFAVF